jgi:biopolymer transport protein ExbD
MAAYLNDNDDGIMSNINITPLVDIVLVLLIIFMVTSHFIRDPIVPVELPRAAHAEDAATQSFALVLDREGQLYINGQLNSKEQARQRLASALRESPDIQAIVAADGHVRYEKVVEIIDLVKSAGVSNFALNVRKPE